MDTAVVALITVIAIMALAATVVVVWAATKWAPVAVALVIVASAAVMLLPTILTQ